MRPRYAVLLTPLESADPTCLLISIINAPVTPLESALTDPSQLAENTAALSLLECALTRFSPATPLESALTKNNGGGRGHFSQFRDSALATLLKSFPFTLLRSLFRDGAPSSLSFSTTSALFPSRRGCTPLSYDRRLLSANPQRAPRLSVILNSTNPNLAPVTSHRSRLTSHHPPTLLHCSTHGSPTPRPTLPRRSPLARRDRALHSRFAAFHGAAPARRSTLLDRNRFGTR